LAYAVTVVILGGFVGLIGYAIAGSIITGLHHVQNGPTPTQGKEAFVVGAATFAVFAVVWYAAVWRIKYHERVSEVWREGPLGAASTICMLSLTTLVTILLSPLILAGIVLGLIQYD